MRWMQLPQAMAHPAILYVAVSASRSVFALIAMRGPGLPPAAPCAGVAGDIAALRLRACRCQGRGRPRRQRLNRGERRTQRRRRKAARRRRPRSRAAAVGLPAGADRGDRDCADACRRSPAPERCGGDDIVRLEAVVLPDKSRVPLKPAATLRCPMAAAVAEWVRSDVAEIASEAGTAVSELDNFDFVRLPRPQPCRRRAHVRTRPRQCARRARRQVRQRPVRVVHRSRGGARDCARKSSPRCARASPPCLGPGSDWYHEDHVHLDLAERRRGYRICQWDIWDPMPKVAPLLPARASGGGAAARDRGGEGEARGGREGAVSERAAEATEPASAAAKQAPQQKRRRRAGAFR